MLLQQLMCIPVESFLFVCFVLHCICIAWEGWQLRLLEKTNETQTCVHNPSIGHSACLASGKMESWARTPILQHCYTSLVPGNGAVNDERLVLSVRTWQMIC